MSIQVICIKLISGEDLIARVGSMSLAGTSAFDTTPYTIPKGQITLEKVRVISLQPISRTEMQVALVPYLLADYDGSMNVDLERHAVTIYAARKDLEDTYLEQTSEIKIAKSSGIALS